MITSVAFKPEHLGMIELKENYEQSDCPTVVMNSAFTLFEGQTVLAIIGVFTFVPGVVHFWALISKHVRKIPIAFHKECKKVIAWYAEYEKPRRMQMDVKADYRMGCKWAEALGFKKEGLMKNWGPNKEDFYLYGRAV